MSTKDKEPEIKQSIQTKNNSTTLTVKTIASMITFA